MYIASLYCISECDFRQLIYHRITLEGGARQQKKKKLLEKRCGKTDNCERRYYTFGSVLIFEAYCLV